MEQVKLFLKKAKSDSGLMPKVEALILEEETPGKLIALAAEYGFTFTPEEFAQHGFESGALSEEDLETVTGGSNWNIPKGPCRWLKPGNLPRYGPDGELRRGCRRWTCWWFEGGGTYICGCHGTDRCIDSEHLEFGSC